MAATKFTQQPGKTATVEISTDIDYRFRFIGLITGTYCAAGAKALGVNQLTGKLADSDSIPVVIDGILIVEAGGTVTAGGKVESDASGRAIDVTTGEVNGYALSGATAAGQKVLVARGI